MVIVRRISSGPGPGAFETFIVNARPRTEATAPRESELFFQVERVLQDLGDEPRS